MVTHPIFCRSPWYWILLHHQNAKGQRLFLFCFLRVQNRENNGTQSQEASKMKNNLAFLRKPRVRSALIAELTWFNPGFNEKGYSCQKQECLRVKGHENIIINKRADTVATSYHFPPSNFPDLLFATCLRADGWFKPTHQNNGTASINSTQDK